MRSRLSFLAVCGWMPFRRIFARGGRQAGEGEGEGRGPPPSRHRAKITSHKFAFRNSPPSPSSAPSLARARSIRFRWRWRRRQRHFRYAGPPYIARQKHPIPVFRPLIQWRKIYLHAWKMFTGVCLLFLPGNFRPLPHFPRLTDRNCPNHHGCEISAF